MRRIVKSFTLDSNTIDKLKKYSDKKLITQSRAIETIINSFLETEPKKKEIAPIKKMTKKEHLADWEWRKGMVADGKFPVRLGEEYPKGESFTEKDVYINDVKNEEDEDFGTSLADAIKTEFST